jgi:hypothetical protein
MFEYSYSKEQPKVLKLIGLLKNIKCRIQYNQTNYLVSILIKNSGL